MFASSKNRWWIVIASMLGLTVSYGAISLFTFAVFLKPVSADLGISRGLMTSGLFVASLVCGLATPLMGMLIDRWGSRRVLLLGIPLFALAIAALCSLQPSPLSIYTLFGCTGFFGAAQNTVPYAKIISNWFDRERGVALGIAMSGMGISVAVVPQIAALMIEATNWRMAYMSVGATIILLALIPVLLFVRDPRPDEMHQRDVRSSTVPPGLALEEALRTWRFWAISVGFFVAVVSTHGALLHVVALMTDRGASTALATAALSTTGIGMIIGRLVCGWALDRFHGPNVAICFLLVPAVGIGCLLNGHGQAVGVIGALLCGIGLGAHVGLLAYFAGRYFGLRAYGKIYGLMFGLFLIGGGVGPFLSGLTFDLLHSYEPALLAFSAALVAVALLLAPLGTYPFAGSQRPNWKWTTPAVSRITSKE